MPSNCSAWRCIEERISIEQSCSSCFRNPMLHATDSVSVGYLSHSIYISHIRHLLKFYPRENFFFVQFEELIQDPVKVLNQICDWLGVGTLLDDEWGDISSKNTNDYPLMNEDEEKFLRQFFRAPNTALYQLLQTNYGWKK